MAYLSCAHLLPTLLSAWFPTGVFDRNCILQVMSKLLQAVALGELGELDALILIDFTTSFDTINHDFLLQHRQQTFCVDGFRRISSVGRSKTLSRCSPATRLLVIAQRTDVCCLMCSVPQGSVPGSMLSILYTFDLIQLIEGHGIAP